MFVYISVYDLHVTMCNLVSVQMVYSVLASTASYNIRARTVGSGPNTADHSLLRKRRKQGRPRPVEPAAGIANRPEASGSGGQLSTAGPSCIGKNRNKSGLLLCPSTEMLPQRHASRVSIYPSRAVLLVVACCLVVETCGGRTPSSPTATADGDRRPATGGVRTVQKPCRHITCLLLAQWAGPLGARSAPLRRTYLDGPRLACYFP
jgi:hypothetical protein